MHVPLPSECAPRIRATMDTEAPLLSQAGSLQQLAHPDSSLWSAAWNLQPRGPACIPAVLRVTWHLQVIVLVFSLTGSVEGDVTMPYKYSRVSCCGVNGSVRPGAARAALERAPPAATC